jgi:hypothetical protein
VNKDLELSSAMKAVLYALASSFGHAPGVQRCHMLGPRQTVRALEVRGLVAVQPCWRTAHGTPTHIALVQLTEDGAAEIHMNLKVIAGQALECAS